MSEQDAYKKVQSDKEAEDLASDKAINAAGGIGGVKNAKDILREVQEEESAAIKQAMKSELAQARKRFEAARAETEAARNADGGYKGNPLG
jgi:hypothetical protein